ncbi:MAG: TRCF domain-containing protein, partial [Rhodospirillales bacterium]
YVCPRIEDLEGLYDQLAELVPEVKVVAVHGRMAVKDLENAVSAFDAGDYDILLSTNIIESGLDLPRVNTIVIHRADMFGLAQLYQLRGRVGRGKARAYAYLTLPPQKKLTPAAEKRLEVMQTLDSLGAGFTLASHDMDIRGAGNLLGEEQSGHIREVGIELYQQMLEEAVAEARGLDEEAAEGDWSPQISLGMSVLIPEGYVADLGLRMSLYRRLAEVTESEQIDGFAAELVDRFGPLPVETENLLATVGLKLLAKACNVEKVDAGPRGATLSFRNDRVANPAALVGYLSKMAGTAKLRPDQKLVFIRDWPTVEKRMAGLRRLMGDLKDVLTG